MPIWHTEIHLPYNDGYISIDNINIERGVFRGDSLSLFLFYMCLVPIMNILKRANIGYKLTSTFTSHLLYIDNLKIYSKNAEEIERFIKLIA